MTVRKDAILSLFFDQTENNFYVLINSSLFKVSEKIAFTIRDKEELMIRHAKNIKEIQTMIRNDV